MFKIFLNAVEIVASKDFRDSAGALFKLITTSPEWQRDIVSIDARLSQDYEERVDLITDLVSEKMESLGYSEESRRALGVCVSELMSNAFTHAASSSGEAIHLQFDVSSTFVAVQVRNPKTVPVELNEWMAKAIKHLQATKKRERGRGLISVYRQSDRLSKVGSDGLKAVFYRQQVELGLLRSRVGPDTFVLIAMAGHKNPSFARRVCDQLRRFPGDTAPPRIVIVLDPSELNTSADRLLSKDAALSIRESLLSRHASRDRVNSRDGLDSRAWYTLVKFVDRYFRSDSFFIICSDPQIRDLFPDDLVTEDWAAAIEGSSHFELLNRHGVGAEEVDLDLLRSELES